MPISSIAGSSLGGFSSTLGGAAKSSGRAFADLFERAKGASSSGVNSATTGEKLGELTRDAETRLSEFKRSMQELFASAGIDTSWEIQLTSDGHGGVQVNGDHPDHDKIQQLLQTNPDLIEKFNALQTAYSRLRSGSQPASETDELIASAFSIKFADGSTQVDFE